MQAQQSSLCRLHEGQPLESLTRDVWVLDKKAEGPRANWKRNEEKVTSVGYPLKVSLFREISLMPL